MAFADAARFAGEKVSCLRGERLVFQALDFTLTAGQALLLQGPNGSGKSSLLRLCAGLLRPAGGRLAWNDADIADDPDAHRGRLRYIGHLDAVKPVFTVAENLRFWARLGGGSDETAAMALARFDLDHLAAVPGRLLSAGQRRRLNLARILAAPAQLWLLDEPTNSLDQAATLALATTIADHRAQGGLVIAASHLDLGLRDAARLELADSRRPA